MIRLVPFEPKFAEVFRQLNIEWLETYALTEAHDLLLLDDPVAHIIDPGGCIFLAEENGGIIGCAGLMKAGTASYELVKMTVAERARGRGISKLLLRRCIEEARALGAERITLLSNHQLEAAIGLYTSFGFTHIPLEPSPFALADVHMQLLLNDNQAHTEPPVSASPVANGQTN